LLRLASIPQQIAADEGGSGGSEFRSLPSLVASSPRPRRPGGRTAGRPPELADLLSPSVPVRGRVPLPKRQVAAGKLGPQAARADCLRPRGLGLGVDEGAQAPTRGACGRRRPEISKGRGWTKPDNLPQMIRFGLQPRQVSAPQDLP